MFIIPLWTFLYITAKIKATINRRWDPWENALNDSALSTGTRAFPTWCSICASVLPWSIFFPTPPTTRLFTTFCILTGSWSSRVRFGGWSLIPCWPSVAMCWCSCCTCCAISLWDEPSRIPGAPCVLICSTYPACCWWIFIVWFSAAWPMSTIWTWVCS